MLLINIHQLDVVFADSVALGALKDNVDDIGGILSLESKNIVWLCGAEDLLQRGEVDAESNVAITSEGREGFRLEHHRDKGNVGVVHGLESDTRVIAVEVAVLHQVLDGIDDLEAD